MLFIYKDYNEMRGQQNIKQFVIISKFYTVSFVACVFETSDDLNDLKICNNRSYTKIIKI